MENDKSKKLILNDVTTDWKNQNIDPSFVISKDKTLIPVFVEHIGETNVAIYVNLFDYNKIDHTRSYVLVHNANAVDAHVPHILNCVNVPFEQDLDENDMYTHHMHMEPM